jgi:hypothetical protein
MLHDITMSCRLLFHTVSYSEVLASEKIHMMIELPSQNGESLGCANIRSLVSGSPLRTALDSSVGRLPVSFLTFHSQFSNVFEQGVSLVAS